MTIGASTNKTRLPSKPWRRSEATERVAQRNRLAFGLRLQRLRIISNYLGVSARIQLLSKLERIAGHFGELNHPGRLAATVAALESLEVKLLAKLGSTSMQEGHPRDAAKPRECRRHPVEPGPGLPKTAPVTAAGGGGRWIC